MAAGPLVFVSAWAVGGARTPGYSPVHDAISRIAAVGAPERRLMTAGFLAYGAFALLGASGIGGSVVARIRGALVVNAAATVAVGLLPLDRSNGGDTLHAVAATVGYVSLAVIPAVAARPLARAGRRPAAAASIGAAVVIAACLVATTVTDASGLAQRIGLTTGDAWLVAAGLAVATGHLRTNGDRLGGPQATVEEAVSRVSGQTSGHG